MGLRYVSLVALVSAALVLTSCGGVSNGGGGGIVPTPPQAAANEWTWMGGSNTVAVNGGHGGVYGAQGVAATTNTPGSREGEMSWTDSSGHFWIFGGYGYSAEGSNPGTAGIGYLNDLWEFDPAAKTWTWVDGANNTSGNFGSNGIYGTLGVAAAANQPGGRWDAVCWTDSQGNLWMFGGAGFDSIGTDGSLNDLWMFSPSTKQWTWESGANTSRVSATMGQAGIYGTLGVAAVTNVPGARGQAIGWTGKDGNLWLFGGNGLDANGNGGFLNDLWTFNPSTRVWTWAGGSSSVVGQKGIYGTQGQAAASNSPGGRSEATGWVDGNGRFWLFGGDGFDSTGDLAGLLNDLWMYDPVAKSWTWMSGSELSGAAGIYGTIGTAAAANTPAPSGTAAGWVDTQNNLWLFGGTTNALWKFSPSNSEWTWVSGTNQTGQAGSLPVYGSLGVASTGNIPGARVSAAAWIDSSNHLWLFGGNGKDSAGDYQELNDLWMYQP